MNCGGHLPDLASEFARSPLKSFSSMWFLRSFPTPESAWLFRRQNVDFSLTEPARNLGADVLLSKAKRFFAMRTLGVTVGFGNMRRGRIQSEIGRAEFALNSLTQVFSIDFQLLMAARTFDEQPDGGDFDQTVDLLKRYERWDFNAVFL